MVTAAEMMFVTKKAKKSQMHAHLPMDLLMMKAECSLAMVSPAQDLLLEVMWVFDFLELPVQEKDAMWES